MIGTIGVGFEVHKTFLKRGGKCTHIVCVKTLTYPLRLDESTYQRIELEAKRRHKSMAAVFREVIGLGLPALPPVPEAAMDGLIADTWEKLGPAPDINYDKL